ncbi:MAG: tRNA dihydrouridine synthase DusB [Clostridiales bacterium]|nr:tRNA dihydrouridine synthase DusB [Clostridiales bacterium]MCF8023539.1 tRNA dihydrouridine synthase DusB [Clostridiales bacterium]
MKIGNLKLQNPVVAAPMAGVTDRAFRLLALSFGCSLVYTEMVSSQAIMHNNKKTFRFMDCRGEPGPVGIQIFGSKPEYMARAAGMAEEYGASLVDINMGCPAPKIVKNSEGASLMKKPVLAAEIVSAVTAVTKLPVTVKIRKGWDEQTANAVEIAAAVENAGAQAVTVHGRFKEQFYSGRADWDVIKNVKKELSVPVIGNGDIFDPQDAYRMMEYTKCDAVMIGRASLGYPWIFSGSIKYLKTGEIECLPGCSERIKTALSHIDLIIKNKGTSALGETKKHAIWYSKGIPGAARIREEINEAAAVEDIKQQLISLC